MLVRERPRVKTSEEVYGVMNDATFIYLLGLLALPLTDAQSSEVADMFLSPGLAMTQIISTIEQMHIKNGTLLPSKPSNLADSHNGFNHT